MVPLADCPEVLRQFRGRMPSDTTPDPAAGDAAGAAMRAYHRTPAGRRTPGDEADHLHRRLAWEAARAVARLAVRVAAGAGELGRLLGTLGRMDAAADAGGGPGWLAAESDEYERLAGRAAVLAGRIERVVVADALRRYRLTALADLYDADEPAFHRLAEAGRRVLTAPGPARPWPADGGWF